VKGYSEQPNLDLANIIRIQISSESGYLEYSNKPNILYPNV